MPKQHTTALFRPRRAWAALPLACVLALGASLPALAQGGPGKPGPGGPHAAPVVAEKARASEVKVYLSALGSVTPLHSVLVKSRVDGELMEASFQEGQTVSAGQLLARIDPRPFEVQLAQAQGQLARDQALLDNARVDVARYRELWSQDSISKQQLDTQEALVRQYEGVVKADQGQVDNAKLQLTYSRVTSPIAGRVGLRLVDPGNIVRASDQGGLVVVTQMQPIAVVFSLPEDNLPQVLGKLKSGPRLPVEVYDRQQKAKLAEGHLLTVDNQIDPGTGTVKLKAVLANKNNELFPNQFVNVKLLAETIKDAIVIPSAAVQRGPQGSYVFVVKPDMTAEMRRIVIGETYDGETVVRSGLDAGELVVAEGADRLREGAKVEMKAKGGPPPGAKPGPPEQTKGPAPEGAKGGR